MAILKDNIIYDNDVKFQVINGFIPKNYSIWNAHILEIGERTFLKLYNDDKVNNFQVCIDDLLAIEVSPEDAKIINLCYCSGGRNPKEVKRALKSKREYIRKRAEMIKPYVEKLFNVKIETN